jgi:hypothetical protein
MRENMNSVFKPLRNIYPSFKNLEYITKSRSLEDKYAWQNELLYVSLSLIADVEYGLI